MDGSGWTPCTRDKSNVKLKEWERQRNGTPEKKSEWRKRIGFHLVVIPQQDDEENDRVSRRNESKPSGSKWWQTKRKKRQEKGEKRRRLARNGVSWIFKKREARSFQWRRESRLISHAMPAGGCEERKREREKKRRACIKAVEAWRPGSITSAN